MKKDVSFDGIIPILPTPFTADGAIDVGSIPDLVAFAKGAGVTAVGMPAYASEFYKLDSTERVQVIEAVLASAGGELPVIVQCNHHAPKVAARLAAEAQKAGADAINTALPRGFGCSERQLLNYAEAVCNATSLPVIIQDWSPAGGCVGLEFALELRKRCANFRYLKLEEHGIGGLIRAIRRETGGAIGVFTGWGGMFLLELQQAGASGVMPALGVADVLVRIWQLGGAGRASEALALFGRILPYIQFSLRTLEQLHHCEKQLLVARGVLRHPAVRPVTIDLDEDGRRYLDFLISELRPCFESLRRH